MMKKKTARSKVLLVEDTLSLVRTYGEYLKDEPVDIDHVETGREAFSRLEAGLPDVVLLDLVLPDIGGLEILKHIHEHQLSCEVVVITAHGSINTAVEAMRLGAFDFLVKPFNAERLRVTLSNALDRHHLAGMVKAYRDTGRKEYCGFVGSSLSMQAVYRIIDSAAQSKATVFITGESGTGKEVCAEAIHARSKRSRGPFIAINCGAIPMDLMESEIFGHVKGAFTGAIAERDGAARRADGGTLFLDEVCEMDMQLQTKLLRFVQTGNFQKVGGSKMETVDIRFVCATNREPYAEVAAGRFREDLFYRLHVIPIQLPRLGERGEDVLAIAEHFLDAYTQEEQKSFGGFSPEVQAAFLAYDWPGNIRQLQNVVRNIVVLNAGGEITLQMLPPPLGEIQDEAPGEAPVPSPSRPTPPPSVAAPAPGQTLAEIERHAIESAIAECDGNVPKAAALLGVSASTLYRKRAAWEQEEGA